MVHTWGFVKSRWDPNGAPLEICEFAVGPQWCTLKVCSFAVGPQWRNHPWGVVNSRWDPNFAPLRFCEFAVGLQVAKVESPLWEQGVYKLQKSQALSGTKGLTSRKSRKPFGGQRWTSRKSRKPFGGTRGLQVALSLGKHGAHKSQALWWTKALGQVAIPFGDQGAY